MGRVPIGGADFSIRPYTYCDQEDESLESFALQLEDLNYKVSIKPQKYPHVETHSDKINE
jgi:hypothetical protein